MMQGLVTLARFIGRPRRGMPAATFMLLPVALLFAYGLAIPLIEEQNVVLVIRTAPWRGYMMLAYFLGMVGMGTPIQGFAPGMTLLLPGLRRQLSNGLLAAAVIVGMIQCVPWILAGEWRLGVFIATCMIMAIPMMPAASDPRVESWIQAAAMGWIWLVWWAPGGMRSAFVAQPLLWAIPNIVVALAQVARMRYPRHAEPRFVDIHSSVTRKLWWRRLLGNPAFVAPAHRLSTHSVRQSLAAAVHERQATVSRVILRTIAWDVALCLLAYRFFPPALAAMLIIPLRAAAAAFSWPIPLRLSYPLGRRDRLRHARAVGVVKARPMSCVI
jgi:hypothetical protein